MAEERRENREDRSGEAPQSAAPAPAKKKKRGKAGLFFLVLLLAAGAATGLHFSGMWDARPLMWSIVPQLPYVGKPISDFFQIPEQYTLTVAERRAYELDERQKYLDGVERRLNEQSDMNASLDVAPTAATEPPVQPAAAQQPTDPPAENQEFRQLVSTMQEMSPRNAAQIVEELNEPLAVELLRKLPTDARSSILSKMDPKNAARLTELMAGAQ